MPNNINILSDKIFEEKCPKKIELDVYVSLPALNC